MGFKNPFKSLVHFELILLHGMRIYSLQIMPGTRNLTGLVFLVIFKPDVDWVLGKP
jgi:hypothetical protein